MRSSLASSLSSAVEVVRGPPAEVLDVEQIRVGNDRGGAFADTAACNQPVRADVAAPVQGAWRRR